jgi:hypothetical protein
MMLGLIGLATTICTGCGEKDPWNRQGLTGTVTFNGEPCKGGSISLMPLTNNNTISGGLIVDGKFSIAAGKGLAPGEYGVAIMIPDPRWDVSLGGEPEQVSPPEWMDGSHKITVTEGGSNEFDFAVENPNLPEIGKGNER